MEAERILIIILSACLIAFLLIAIFFLIQLVQISRSVKSLAEKVDDAAEDVISVSHAVRKLATPIAMSGVITKVINSVFKSTKKKRGKR